VIFASVEDDRLEKRNKCFENVEILKVTFREEIVGEYRFLNGVPSSKAV
jgi:hypothetical protein